MHRNKGFTLLEAIVALVLIGGAGMALFTWVNSSIVALRRVEDANARSDATANVIEYMQSVNPMLTPEGKANFGSYQIKWKAVPITTTVDGTSNPNGISLYQLSLYDTLIKAEKSSDPRWFDLKLILVGYKKVRENIRPF